MKTKILEYEKLFEIVRAELNQLDPLKIISSNKNLIDEYDFENQKIISIINENNDYKDFANKICEIFTKSTKANFKAEDFYDCAKNILEKSKNL